MLNDQDMVAERIMARCDALAAFSELSDGVLRQYLTTEHQRANQQVARWLSEAGLSTWQDSVGNQWGRLSSSVENAPRLIIGSHLDTVPYAGKYDGILGVLIGLELLQYFSKQPSLPFHLDVVGFADEEGTRYGTTLIGSQALANQFSGKWLALEDKDGKTMHDALVDFGLNPNNVMDSAIDPKQVMAYWEVHIEQGPVLEANGEPLGVVSGIAGAKRANVAVEGKAGHAGTTPMNLRADALSGAAELISAIEGYALECVNGEVATVGNIQVKPGAANVIAGNCSLSLDVRALSDQHRDALIRKIEKRAADIATQRGLNISFDWYHDAGAVLCAQSIQQLLTQAGRHQGLNMPTLPSGAGHDAMAIASIAPVGMLFVRSPGGISHHPDESVLENDVALAFETMKTAIIEHARLNILSINEG